LVLYGYSIVQGIVNAQVSDRTASGQALYPPAAKSASGWNARSHARESVPAFPQRYGGAFIRQSEAARQPVTERCRALGPPARSMLERELGRDAAERLIQVVERMAAAADSGRGDFPPPGR